MSTSTDSFTYWAAEMLSILEDETLEHSRWFARVNSVLVSVNKPTTCLYSTELILKTPQNLTTWRSEHGEDDVNSGITMIRNHIQTHWRPSWYEIAGALRPEEGMFGKPPRVPSAPLVVAAVDRHSRTPSPDVMDTKHTSVNAVSTVIHPPLPSVLLSDIRQKRLETPQGSHSKEHAVKFPSSIVSHKEKTVDIPRAPLSPKVREETLPALQVQAKIPGSIGPEGPMTRSRSRDENVNQPTNATTTKGFAGGESAFVGTEVPSKGKEVQTVTRPPKATTRRVLPRQPTRTRQAPADARPGKRPERNVRRKTVHEVTEDSKGKGFLHLPLWIHRAHLT